MIVSCWLEETKPGTSPGAVAPFGMLQSRPRYRQAAYKGAYHRRRITVDGDAASDSAPRRERGARVPYRDRAREAPGRGPAGQAADRAGSRRGTRGDGPGGDRQARAGGP